MTNYAEQFAMSQFASRADRDGAMLAEIEHLAIDLQTERAAVVALRAELANVKVTGIHSCHAGCTRSGCVAGRLRDALQRIVNSDDAHATLHAADGDDVMRMLEYGAAMDAARAALKAST